MATFGYTGADGANTTDIENVICGGKFTMGAINGAGDSITAYVSSDGIAKKMKCALYDSDSNLVTNGVTEEKSIITEGGLPYERTFNFIGTKPLLVANADYYIVVWSESTVGTAYLWDTTEFGSLKYYKSETYNSFPSSVLFTVTLHDKANIYCTYSFLQECTESVVSSDLLTQQARKTFSDLIVSSDSILKSTSKIYSEVSNLTDSISNYLQFYLGELATLSDIFSSRFLAFTSETFGYETAGGSGAWIGDSTPTSFGKYARGTAYVPTYSGTLTKMHAFIYFYGGSSRSNPPISPGPDPSVSGDFPFEFPSLPEGMEMGSPSYSYDLEIGIYEEDFYGADSHKLIEKHTAGPFSTGGWIEVTGFSSNIIAGKHYILIAMADPPVNPLVHVQIDLAYDDVEANRYYEQSFFFFGWRDPWNKAEDGTGRNYSIYCTYLVPYTFQKCIESILMTDSIQSYREIYRNFIETATLIDSISLPRVQILTDTTSIIDSILKHTSKTLTESLFSTDIVQKQLQFILIDSISIDDILSFLTIKSFLDIINSIDSFSPGLYYTFEDTVILTDIITKFTVTLYFESIIISDTLEKYLEAHLSLSDIIILSDVLFKSVSKTYLEIVALSDVFSKLTKKIFLGTIILTDSIEKSISLFRLLSDIFTLTDTVSFSTSIFKIETITSTESIENYLEAHRDFTENIILSDALLKLSSTTFSETINAIDVTLLVTSIFLFEDSILADSIENILTAFRLFQESLSLTDSINIYSILFRTYSELTTISDTVENFLSALKELTDIISSADSILIVGAFYRILEEDISLIDSTLFYTQFSLFESVGITDLIQKYMSYVRLFDESLSLTDLISRYTIYSRVCSNNINTSDTFTSYIQLYRTYSETINSFDIFSKSALFGLINEEVISLIDAITVPLVRILTETVILSDSLINVTWIWKDALRIESYSNQVLRMATKSLMS